MWGLRYLPQDELRVDRHDATDEGMGPGEAWPRMGRLFRSTGSSQKEGERETTTCTSWTVVDPGEERARRASL